jgi:hypothetical protein
VFSARSSLASPPFFATGTKHKAATICGKAPIMAFDGSRAQFYRDQARRLRTIAEACGGPDVKQELEQIAVQYESLARQVDIGLLPQ